MKKKITISVITDNIDQFLKHNEIFTPVICDEQDYFEIHEDFEKIRCIFVKTLAIPHDFITSKSRKRMTHVYPRHLFKYFLHEMGYHKFYIERTLGFDHATTLWSITQVNNLWQTEDDKSEFKNMFYKLQKAIKDELNININQPEIRA